MKKSLKKIVSALTLAAVFSLQFTVSVFADSVSDTRPPSSDMSTEADPGGDVTQTPEFEIPDADGQDGSEDDADIPYNPDGTDNPDNADDTDIPDNADDTDNSDSAGDIDVPDNTDDVSDDAGDVIIFEDTDETAVLEQAIETVKDLEDDIPAPAVGVQGNFISDEDMAAIAMVVAGDNITDDGVVGPYIKNVSYNFSTDYFYNQMTVAEKTLYNNIVNACNTLLNSGSNLTSQYMQTISYDSSISYTRLSQVYWAVYYSNPQFYFLSSGFSYSSSYIAPAVYSDFTMASVRQTTYNAIQNVTNTWMSDISRYSSDLDKEKAIYTKIINQVVYTNGTYDQSIVGALVEGKCVCNGYAMAMTYFCNAAGIDCITVVSTDHAWNRVKLGNYWYEIDVTFMDQGSYIWDIWCNKSEATFHSQDLAYDSSRLSHTIDAQTINQYYSGWTLPSCTRDDPASVGKPVITKAAAGDGRVSLAWSGVTGATQYKVYTYINGTYKLAGTVTGTSYTVTGLTNGVRTGFLVRAYVNGTWSSYTIADIVYATPVGTAKPVITNAIAGDSKVSLTWTGVAGATQYKVYTYINGTYKLAGTVAGTSYTVTGLVNGIRTGFLVRAYVNGTWSSYTTADIIYATPVGAAKPVITKATPGNGKVALTWSGVAGATQYKVYTYINGTYKLAGTVAGTSYTVTGLANGIRTGFLVRAYVNGTWSSYTSADIVYATPNGSSAKPSITKATPGNGSVTLTWTSISGASKYRVYTYFNGAYTVIKDVTSTSYTVTGLYNGIRTGFLVRAYVNGKWTSYTSSDVVFATPVQGSTKPAITKATPGNGKVALTWTSVSGASKYRVYTYFNGAYSVVADVTSTSYTVTGLSNEVRTGFLVRAYVNGKWTAYTGSDVVFATPSANAGKPVITSATAGNGAVTIKWKAVSGASSYRIYKYLNSKYTVVTDVASSITSYTVTGLTNGVKTGFLVRANVNGKLSAYSGSDVVFATPVNTSAKPVIKNAVAGNGQVYLSWSSVSGASKYRVYTYINGKFTNITDTAGTAYTVMGLTNGVSTGFLVRSCTNGVWSSYTASDIVYATPVGTTSVVPSVTAISGNCQATLSWQAITGASQYRVSAYVNGTWKDLGTTTGTIVTITKLTNGVQYCFGVSAYVNGKWSERGIIYVTPSMVVTMNKLDAQKSIGETDGGVYFEFKETFEYDDAA